MHSCEELIGVPRSHAGVTPVTSQVQTKKEEPRPPASSQSIPAFYFPRGRPQDSVNIDAVIAKIERAFAQFPQERATMEDMGTVAKVGVPTRAAASLLLHHPDRSDLACRFRSRVRHRALGRFLSHLLEDRGFCVSLPV